MQKKTQISFCVYDSSPNFVDVTTTRKNDIISFLLCSLIHFRTYNLSINMIKSDAFPQTQGPQGPQKLS